MVLWSICLVFFLKSWCWFGALTSFKDRMNLQTGPTFACFEEHTTLNRGSHTVSSCASNTSELRCRGIVAQHLTLRLYLAAWKACAKLDFALSSNFDLGPLWMQITDFARDILQTSHWKRMRIFARISKTLQFSWRWFCGLCWYLFSGTGVDLVNGGPSKNELIFSRAWFLLGFSNGRRRLTMDLTQPRAAHLEKANSGTEELLLRK